MGGLCSQETVPVIVTGEDFALDVFMTKDSTNQPFDLSGATEIIAVLPNNDGSFLEKKLTTGGIVLVSGPGGNFTILGTPVESKLLKPNNATSLDIRITIGGKLTIVVIENAINVIPPAYPDAP